MGDAEERKRQNVCQTKNNNASTEPASIFSEVKTGGDIESKVEQMFFFVAGNLRGTSTIIWY
jgi:hypothetical protein